MKKIAVILSVVLVLSIASIGYSGAMGGFGSTTTQSQLDPLVSGSTTQKQLGPVLSLELDDAINPPSAVDSSSNSNNAFCYEGNCPASVEGNFGNALSFNGVNTYLEVKDSPSLNPTDAITISTWIYSYPNRDGPGGGTVLVKGTLTGPSWAYSANQYWLSVKTPSEVIFSLGQDKTIKYKRSSDIRIPGDIPPSISEWHHIVGVYDGTKMQLWIDGSKVKEITVTGKIAVTSDPLYIGSNNNQRANGNFNGIIDETLIYNRAISNSEIQQLYKNGLTGSKKTFSDSLNKNNAFCYNTNCPETVDGKHEKALSFNAENKNYLEVKSSNPSLYLPALGSNAFAKGYSTSLWFKTTTKNSGLYSLLNGIEGKYNIDINGAHSSRTLYLDSSGNICQRLGSFYMWGGAWVGRTSCTSGTDYADGKWHNAIQSISVDSSEYTQAKIYVDGEEKASDGPKGAGGYEGADRIWIGYSNENGYFSGTIDDFTLYDRAVSLEDAVQINNTNSQSIENNILNLKFEDDNNLIDYGTTTTESTSDSNTIILLHMNEPLNYVGNFIDSSGLGNHGTCSGSSCPVFGEKGKFGNSVFFSGKNYIEVKNSPSLSITGPMTLEAWIKPVKFDSYDPIFSSSSYGFERKSGGGIAFWINDGSWKESHSSSDVPLSEWTHVVGVYDGTNIKIYINGVQSGTATLSGNPIPLTGNILIGHNNAGNDPGRWWDGSIDRVLVYNKVLTDEEILQHYQETLGKQRDYSLYLNFNEPVDSSVFEDMSSSKNNAMCSGDACPASGAEGHLMNAVLFDGVNDYLELPNSDAIEFSGSGTISAWVKLSSKNPSTIFRRGQDGGIGGWGLGLHFDGSVFMADAVYTTPGENRIEVKGTSNPEVGEWHNVILVWNDGKSLDIYVDGIKEGNFNTTGKNLRTSNKPSTIGSSVQSSYFSGAIDEVKVYKRALSDKEVSEFYYSQGSRVVKINQGWNFIASPYAVHIVDSDCTDVSIYHYNSLTKSYDQISSLAKIKPGIGYWIKSSLGCNIEFSGTKLVTHNNIGDVPGSLKLGWNQIAGTTVPTDIYYRNGNCDISAVYDYNSGTGKYYKASFIEPEKSYWIYAKGKTVELPQTLKIDFDFESQDAGTCPSGWTCTGDALVVGNGDGRGCGFAGAASGSKYFKIGCDGSIGTAFSPFFKLPVGVDKITFLRAGGADAGSGFYLFDEAETLLCSSENGQNSDTFFVDQCTGLSSHEGKKVQIKLTDAQNSGWGKTYIDKITLLDASGNVLLPENPSPNTDSCILGRNVIEMQASCKEFAKSSGVAKTTISTPEGQMIKIDLGEVRDIQQIVSNQPSKDRGFFKLRTSSDDKDWTAWNILRYEKIPSKLVYEQYVPISVRYIEINTDSDISAYAGPCKNMEDTGDVVEPALPILELYDKTPAEVTSDAIVISSDKSEITQQIKADNIYLMASDYISSDNIDIKEIIIADYLKDYKLVVIPHYIDNIPSKFLSDLADTGVVVLLYNDATDILKNNQDILASGKYIGMKEALSKNNLHSFIINGNDIKTSQSKDFEDLINILNPTPPPSNVFALVPTQVTLEDNTFVRRPFVVVYSVEKQEAFRQWMDLPGTLYLEKGSYKIIVYDANGVLALRKSVTVIDSNQQVPITGQLTDEEAATGVANPSEINTVLKDSTVLDAIKGSAAGGGSHPCSYDKGKQCGKTVVVKIADITKNPTLKKAFSIGAGAGARGDVANVGLSTTKTESSEFECPVSLASNCGGGTITHCHTGDSISARPTEISNIYLIISSCGKGMVDYSVSPLQAEKEGICKTTS